MSIRYLKPVIEKAQQQLKARLNPVRVVISVFSDKPLPAPHMSGCVHVSYARRECEHKALKADH